MLYFELSTLMIIREPYNDWGSRSKPKIYSSKGIGTSPLPIKKRTKNVHEKAIQTKQNIPTYLMLLVRTLV
jgi:hypothetical protein